MNNEEIRNAVLKEVEESICFKHKDDDGNLSCRYDGYEIRQRLIEAIDLAIAKTKADIEENTCNGCGCHAKDVDYWQFGYDKGLEAGRQAEREEHKCQTCGKPNLELCPDGEIVEAIAITQGKAIQKKASLAMLDKVETYWNKKHRCCSDEYSCDCEHFPQELARLREEVGRGEA